MSDDLSAAMADNTYKLTANAKVGDVMHFTIKSAFTEKVPDFNDKNKINTKIFVRVNEDPRKVKLDKQGAGLCFSAWGADPGKWVGKKLRGVAAKTGTGVMYIAFEPE